jgi:predicted membrane metal-binding protein
LESHVVGVILSGLVILMTVFAIYVFIAYGGNALFYAVAAIGLALAFFNAWLMAKGFYNTQPQAESQSAGMRNYNATVLKKPRVRPRKQETD